MRNCLQSVLWLDGARISVQTLSVFCIEYRLTVGWIWKLVNSIAERNITARLDVCLARLVTVAAWISQHFQSHHTLGLNDYGHPNTQQQRRLLKHCTQFDMPQTRWRIGEFRQKGHWISCQEAEGEEGMVIFLFEQIHQVRFHHYHHPCTF